MSPPDGPPTIGAAWRALRDRFRDWKLGTPELDARLLAARAFGRDALGLVVGEGDPAPPEGLLALEGFGARRVAGEPVARILGEQEFYGLPFALNAATLVPRPETELLVEIALDVLGGVPSPRILDLGTGSGCVAIAILAQLPEARAIGVDLAPDAIDAAAANARRHGVDERLGLLTGSWFEPLPTDAAFDLIVSNPPYVPTATIGTLAREVRAFDPPLALDGGHDGLAPYRAILAGAPRRLRAGGAIALEIGHDQGASVSALVGEAGFTRIALRRDLAGLDRVVVAHHLQG